MREQGIKDNSLAKSLGVFALSVGIILLLVALFVLIRRFSCCTKVKDLLKKQLFYSGPIRYIIVSYLKLANQFMSLLFVALVRKQNYMMAIGYCFVVVALWAWPLFTQWFLIKNQKHLKNTAF